MWNIIGKRNIYFSISGLATIAAIVVVALFGFRQGIDFSGGTLWQFQIPGEPPATEDVEAVLKNDLKVPDARLNFDATTSSFLVRMPAASEADHQQLLGELRKKYPELRELGFQSIGPSIGHELRTDAMIALVLVLFGISLYIAFAFRKVSRPVSSWKYGVITLVTLFHDVVIPAGLLAFLGKTLGIEIDTNFIVALLVVAGFSVHDTIVVFDRIRENLFLDRGKTPFDALVNQSVNQTFARSVNTSLTLILVLVALLFAGPESLFYFILTLLVGISTGIYSSIFIASPMLFAWQKFASQGGATRKGRPGN